MITFPIFILSLIVVILFFIAIIAFLIGKNFGHKEALKSLSLIIEPFIEVKETFFKKEVVSGYQTTILYHGIKIGETSRTELQRVELSKDENINHLIDSISTTVKEIASAFQPNIAVMVKKAMQIAGKK